MIKWSNEAKKLKRKEAKRSKKLFFLFRKTKRKGSETVSVTLRFASQREKKYKRKLDTLARTAYKNLKILQKNQSALFWKLQFIKTAKNLHFLKTVIFIE